MRRVAGRPLLSRTLYNTRFPEARPSCRASYFWRHAMADYFEQTVVQQSIPETDMTPLVRLLLSRIFQSERDGEAWSFFAEDNPCTMVHATRAELVEALGSSPDRDSAA